MRGVGVRFVTCDRSSFSTSALVDHRITAVSMSLCWASLILSHATPSEVPKCLNNHLPKQLNTSNLGQHHSPHLSPTRLPATTSRTPHSFTTSTTAMVVDSTIRNASPERDSVRISAASAFNICDGLFRMANCFVTELPEAELRDVRYVLNTLLTKVDRLLHPTEEYDLSLNFGGLTVDASKSLRSTLIFPRSSHPPQTFAAIQAVRTLAQVQLQPPPVLADQRPPPRLAIVETPFKLQLRFQLWLRSQTQTRPQS